MAVEFVCGISPSELQDVVEDLNEALIEQR